MPAPAGLASASPLQCSPPIPLFSPSVAGASHPSVQRHGAVDSIHRMLGSSEVTDSNMAVSGRRDLEVQQRGALLRLHYTLSFQINGDRESDTPCKRYPPCWAGLPRPLLIAAGLRRGPDQLPRPATWSPISTRATRGQQYEHPAVAAGRAVATILRGARWRVLAAWLMASYTCLSWCVQACPLSSAAFS